MKQTIVNLDDVIKILVTNQTCLCPASRAGLVGWDVPRWGTTRRACALPASVAEETVSLRLRLAHHPVLCCAGPIPPTADKSSRRWHRFALGLALAWAFPRARWIRPLHTVALVPTKLFLTSKCFLSVGHDLRVLLSTVYRPAGGFGVGDAP